MEQNETWKFLKRTDLPPEMKTNISKWVFERKQRTDGNGIRYKARLVARGFEQVYGIDYLDTFAPSVWFRTVRILLALAATLGLDIHQIDFKTAFLNAWLPEDQQVYREAHSSFELGEEGENADPSKDSVVLMVVKTLYGLKQSPRE
jgi:hypothetical protein